jgi:CBS domain-containing protein
MEKAVTAHLDRLDRWISVDAVTTFDPVAAAPSDDITELARLMTEIDCGSLIVLGPAGETSIVTERDIVRAMAGGATEACAADVMSRDVVTVPADLTIGEAAATMLEVGIRHLVVERSDGELGITSIRDLVDALLAEDE